LQGLLDAHRRGVIHRDLKPHNLLLTADGDLKLADFGLFQPLAAPAETAGSVSGTPPYMSPEQAAGRPLDGRSDLFSLGSTFFQLFTGRLPFPGDDPADVMARLIRLDAPRLCQVASSLPLPLDVILGRMMARDPLARYQDARIALDDLASYESRGLIRAVDLTLTTDDATDDLALTATHHEAPPTGG
jgi:serine/threonine-protein kinase